MPRSRRADYQDIVKNDAVKVVYISTTPESTHFPIARDCLKAGKHVLLEKPIALELYEADELIAIAKRNHVKFTIGYSQRFNTKFAYAKKKLERRHPRQAGVGDGEPASVAQPRQEDRKPGAAVARRDGIRHTISISCSGSLSPPSPSASIRKGPMAT